MENKKLNDLIKLFIEKVDLKLPKEDQFLSYHIINDKLKNILLNNNINNQLKNLYVDAFVDLNLFIFKVKYQNLIENYKILNENEYYIKQCKSCFEKIWKDSNNQDKDLQKVIDFCYEDLNSYFSSLFLNPLQLDFNHSYYARVAVVEKNFFTVNGDLNNFFKENKNILDIYYTLRKKLYVLIHLDRSYFYFVGKNDLLSGTFLTEWERDLFNIDKPKTINFFEYLDNTLISINFMRNKITKMPLENKLMFYIYFE